MSLLLCACKSDVTTVVKGKESMFSKPGILLRIEGAFVLAMFFSIDRAEQDGASSLYSFCGPTCRW